MLGKFTYRFMILSLASSLVCPAFSASTVPFSGAFAKQVEQTFFSGQNLSILQIQNFRELVQKKMRFLEENDLNTRFHENGRPTSGEDIEKIRKKAHAQDTYVALSHVLDVLNRMEKSWDPVEQRQLAAEALMIEYSTRLYTDPRALIKISEHLVNMFQYWSLPLGTHPDKSHLEASNLWNAQTNSYYDASDLAQLTKSGFDISTLNPNDGGGTLWRPQNIGNLDIKENYYKGAAVFEGLDYVVPPSKNAEVVLDDVQQTQTKPKLIVKYVAPNGHEYKIKLKFGDECHAEPTVNSLLSAVGYNADISVHTKAVKVYLNKISEKKLRKKWAEYFDQQEEHARFPIETTIQAKGQDEKGDYIIFREGLFELKPRGANRIGPFSFGWGMGANMRESRALYIFNAWVGNTDLKDAENNKLILKETTDGSYKMFLMNHDLGHSLGSILSEKPNAFPTSIIRKIKKDSIQFTYFDLQDTGLEKTTTFADAKWMVRLIAQLSRKQIEDGVRLGGWFDAAARLYTEKLINRRNELVRAFGLEQEFPMIPVDTKLTTSDKSVVDGKLTVNEVPDSSVTYNDYPAALFRPVYKALGTAFAELSLGGLSQVDDLTLTNLELGGGAGVIPELLVTFGRNIVPNPNAKSDYDQFLVEDVMRLGFRLGVGVIGTGTAGYAQKFTLVYPARNRKEAALGINPFKIFMMPFDVKNGKLPNRFVLIREDEIEVGGRVDTRLLPTYSPVVFENDITRIRTHRSVIDRKGKDFFALVDKTTAFQNEFKARFDFVVGRVPFLKALASQGTLKGTAWKLKESDLETKQGSAAVTAAIAGDFSQLDKLKKPLDYSSEFQTREHALKLFFFGMQYSGRNDLINVSDSEGKAIYAEDQIQRKKINYWTFLDNGESRTISVKGFAKQNIINVDYSVEDLDTNNGEFNEYYSFLQSLAGKSTYLPVDFNANDWIHSGLNDALGLPSPSSYKGWTRILSTGSVAYYAGALKALINTTDVEYWKAIAENSKIPLETLDLCIDKINPSYGARINLVNSKADPFRELGPRASARNNIDPAVALIVSHGVDFMRAMAEARAAKNETDRTKALVKALYRANYKSSGARKYRTFSDDVIGGIHKAIRIDELAQRGEAYIEANIRKDVTDEVKMPEHKPIVASLGTRKPLAFGEMIFSPKNAVDVYNISDWLDK